MTKQYNAPGDCGSGRGSADIENACSGERSENSVAPSVTPEAALASLLAGALWSPAPVVIGTPHHQLLVLSGGLVPSFWKRFAATQARGLALINRPNKLVIAGVGPFFPTVAITDALAICPQLAPQYQPDEQAPLNAFAEWLREGAR